jgi:DNA-directed RNA polymerase subunit RPC12/RpoP
MKCVKCGVELTENNRGEHYPTYCKNCEWKIIRKW